MRNNAYLLILVLHLINVFGKAMLCQIATLEKVQINIRDKKWRCPVYYFVRQYPHALDLLLQIANSANLYTFLLPHSELKFVAEHARRRIRVCPCIYPHLTFRI